MLADRCYSKVMMTYINRADNLKIIMNLLRNERFATACTPMIIIDLVDRGSTHARAHPAFDGTQYACEGLVLPSRREACEGLGVYPGGRRKCMRGSRSCKGTFCLRGHPGLQSCVD